MRQSYDIDCICIRINDCVGPISTLQATAKGGRHKALSVAWNENGTRMVTCGLRHVSFWTLSGRNLSHCRGVFGGKGKKQSCYCCAFIENTVVVSERGKSGFGFVRKRERLLAGSYIFLRLRSQGRLKLCTQSILGPGIDKL